MKDVIRPSESLIEPKNKFSRPFTLKVVKVGFSQKVMAKFFILSNCHSCEPKIVPALLIPVKDNNKILAIL